MNHPLQIVFHGMDHSDAVEAKIREKAEVLDRYSDRITKCRVVFDQPHQHQHQGSLFSVRIELSVPGAPIIVTKEHRGDPAHEDAYIAIRDAFEAAKRQLADRHDKNTKHR